MKLNSRTVCEFLDRQIQLATRPADARALALVRIGIMGGVLFLHLSYRHIEKWFEPVVLPSWQPTGIGHLLTPWIEYLAHPSVASSLWWIFTLSTVAALAGLGWRITSILSLLGSLFFVSVANGIGHMFRVELPLIFAQAVLVASYANHAWSLDSLFRKKSATVPPVEFAWPIAATQFVLIHMYFLAGLAKVFARGEDLIRSPMILAREAIYQNAVTRAGILEGQWYEAAGHWVAQRDWAVGAIGWGTMFFELGVVVLWLRLPKRWLFVPIILFMQMGVYLLLGIEFLLPLFLLISFLAADAVRLYDKIIPRLRRP